MAFFLWTHCSGASALPVVLVAPQSTGSVGLELVVGGFAGLCMPAPPAFRHVLDRRWCEHAARLSLFPLCLPSRVAGLERDEAALLGRRATLRDNRQYTSVQRGHLVKFVTALR